jgi:hypothetical protein
MVTYSKYRIKMWGWGFKVMKWRHQQINYPETQFEFDGSITKLYYINIS